MDIHHLKVFLSVFKNKSFSKASSELSLTQPTISSHIKALENELGCKLFDRMGRIIIPTKEATRLYEHAAEITGKLEEIKSKFGLSKDGINGKLVIGASTIPGTYILPSLAAGFKKKYRDISFHILIEDSKKITDMVSDNELLIGIVGAKMENDKIAYMSFTDDELILVSKPQLFDKKIIDARSLVKLPFLLREEGSGTRKMMEKYLDEIGIGPSSLNVAGIFGSTDSVREAVKSGFGVSILSKIAVRSELKAGEIKEIRIKGPRMKRSFYIITRKKRTLPENYKAFLNYLKHKS